MGIMGNMAKKITPKETPKVLTKIAPSIFPPKAGPPPSDDDPTWFTTFMIIYYGFFAITLLVYPQVHTTAPMFGYVNPLAFWTTISPQMEFIFRMLGMALLTILVGPFTDDIFGGVGVRMKAFTEQLLVGNIITWVIFTYYGFYAPLPTAVATTWTMTAYLGSFILAWNVIELVPADKLKTYYAMFNALLFCGFGVSLASMPSFFFGPPSPVAYWTGWADLDVMFGRFLGISILALCGVYYWFASTNTFCKTILFFNTFNTALFVQAAFFGGSSSVSKMWEVQLSLGIAIYIVALYLELSGATGDWKAAWTVNCGANVETFNIINFFWFVPFVIGFYSKPNMLFGPGAITGFPMFLTELEEISLWFGKAWAAVVLAIVLGPILFGAPQVGTAKAIVFMYFAYVVAFAYGLVEMADTFNFIVIVPVASINFLLGCFGLYVVLPQTSGEPML